jgi:hypothetical protein
VPADIDTIAASNPYDTYKGIPVNYVSEVVDQDFIIRGCVICGDTHHHTGLRLQDVGVYSRQSAKCDQHGEEGKDVYFVVLTYETGGIGEVKFMI